jgi:hypothetical protein
MTSPFVANLRQQLVHDGVTPWPHRRRVDLSWGVGTRHYIDTIDLFDTSHSKPFRIIEHTAYESSKYGVGLTTCTAR